MYSLQVAEIRSKLLRLIPNDPDAISRLSDHIQKLAKFHPSLTAGCEFSQAQLMRRLLILPRTQWQPTDTNRAAAAVKKIQALLIEPGPNAALKLACYGIARADLDEAIRSLEAARDAAQPAAPAAVDEPAACPDGAQDNAAAPVAAPEKAGKAKGKAARADKPSRPDQPTGLLHSLSTLDEAELDPQTLADLQALEQEVKGLQCTDPIIP